MLKLYMLICRNAEGHMGRESLGTPGLSGLPQLSKVAIYCCIFPLSVDLSSFVTTEFHLFAEAKGLGTFKYICIFPIKREE